MVAGASGSPRLVAGARGSEAATSSAAAAAGPSAAASSARARAAAALQPPPQWLLVPDPPRQEVYDRYERLTNALIQLNALRKLWHHLGDYLKYVKKRGRIIDGDTGGSPGTGSAAGRRH